MSEYKHLFKTIVGRSPEAIARRIQHFIRLGFYILNGQVHSRTKLKSLLPFRLETEYTVFMQKNVKKDAPHGSKVEGSTDEGEKEILY